MANTIFIADNTIPGLGAADFVRRAAADMYTGSSLPAEDSRWRRALRAFDRGLLRDIGLDGGAA